MYDINFFSVYKKKRGKNNGLKVFIAVFVIILLVFNVAIIGGGLLFTNSLKARIADKQAYINSDVTKEKIAAANKVRQEADLTGNYLKALKQAASGFEQIDLINTALLTEIRKLTPTTTVISSSLIEGNVVTLNCISANTSDPIDMYHAMLLNPNFANVTFSGFMTDPTTGVSGFMIAFQVTGGIEP